MAERFFVDQPLTTGRFELTGTEAHHLAQVCRLGPGDAVCLFNGDGREYPGVIVSAQRRAVMIDVAEVRRPQREQAAPLEVAAALPRGDRGHFLIEKLTELGVTSFVPLECARSVVHPRGGKMEKLERYVIEASKQCGRNVLMRVAPPMLIASYVACAEPGDLCLLAHPGGESLLARPRVQGAYRRVAIGPEGGFTDAEVALAREAGWHPVSLGPRLLRVETAAIAVAACLTMVDASLKSVCPPVEEPRSDSGVL